MDSLRSASSTPAASRVRDGLSANQWATFARGAERIAASVSDQTGLRTVFHPHCGGYIEAPGKSTS